MSVLRWMCYVTHLITSLNIMVFHYPTHLAAYHRLLHQARASTAGVRPSARAMALYL